MTTLKVAVTIATFGTLVGVATPARADGFSCQVADVAELFNQRVHVRCSNTITMLNPVTGQNNVIRFIVVPTSDVQRANRFITIANAALLSGKAFFVDIPRSSATNASGCAVTDCRTPDTFAIRR